MMWCAVLSLLFLESAHYERAHRYFQQRRFTEAEAELAGALRENPDLVPALTLQAKLAMGFNRFDEARAALLRAARLQPESAGVQFLLGFFYSVDNDFHKAVEALDLARRLNPTDPRITFYLALSRDGLGQADAAVALYRTTIALEKTAGKPAPDVHVAFARLLFSLGRFEESERQVALALALDPQSRDAHYEQGRLRFERGEFAQAADEGEKALAIPGIGTLDRQIHFLLARAYAKLGKRELSAAHLARFKASGASLRR